MVTAPHAPVPFSPALEDLYIPSPAKIEAAVRAVMGRATDGDPNPSSCPNGAWRCRRACWPPGTSRRRRRSTKGRRSPTSRPRRSPTSSRARCPARCAGWWRRPADACRSARSLAVLAPAPSADPYPRLRRELVALRRRWRRTSRWRCRAGRLERVAEARRQGGRLQNEATPVVLIHGFGGDFRQLALQHRRTGEEPPRLRGRSARPRQIEQDPGRG